MLACGVPLIPSKAQWSVSIPPRKSTEWTDGPLESDLSVPLTQRMVCVHKSTQHDLPHS